MASEARTGPEATATTGNALGVTERSRQVWLVLTICLLAFVVLCGLSIYGATSFLSSITVGKTANLQPYSPMAVLRHGSVITEQVSSSIDLQEGDTVITQPQNSRGLIRLFDQSTVQISLDTELVLNTLRSNEFFGRAQDVGLTLKRGSIYVARSTQEGVSSQYTVSTDEAVVDIEPNAKVRFTVDGGDNPVTQVVVDEGRATFRSRGKTIELSRKEMAWVSTTEEPQGPLVAEKNFVKNGNFMEGPTSSKEEVSEGGLGVAGWTPIRDEGAPPVPAGSVTITNELGLRAALIDYEGAQGRYPRVGMVQEINESAEFYSTIELSATVKLVRQEDAVRGGGDLYPLIIKVVYLDSGNQIHEWRSSFYSAGDPEDLSDLSRVQVPIGKWESTGEIRDVRQDKAGAEGRTDLLDLNAALFMLKSPGVNPPPDIAVIRTIEVYGYGTDFQSWITGISLLAR